TPASSRPMPESVLSMARAWLEAVGAYARPVLRAASVYGEVFWPGGVEALLDEALPAGWEEGLVARELLARHPESRFAGERELAFRHVLLREGAYATLTEADRPLGHQLARTWLAAHGERDPMVLAQPFNLAGEGFAARAGSFYLAAAWQALRGADADAAVARAERALASPIAGELRGEAHSLLCESHAWRG